MSSFEMREMVTVGEKKLIGEVIALDGDIGTIQVYEETEGLTIGETIEPSGKPLSLKLGPGLLKNMFDGIERPLKKLFDISGNFIAEGIGLISIDEDREWYVEMLVKKGEFIDEGYPIAEIQETHLISHKIMMPPGQSGHVKFIKEDGRYKLNDIICELENERHEPIEIKLYQEWPVRVSRPILERKTLSMPLLTGQRVLDIFFPIAKGGTAAIPGGFGTGKTMTQHQLAKWSDADIIVYIGCGERGNEMTDVLNEFPKLIDPMSGESIMERTVLIANTSNMPVAAREASIYTGITIAEYYRDMGYHVAIMADSTSRWAEALRELSGRLEEMPAEEGYPAYLPSRLAGFYERAGLVETLCGQEASVTIIGAVSPAGGDFSEPVTENTKRFVNAFLALDKRLAYARHYPAINWLDSYSGYIKSLEDWYTDYVSHDILELRAEMLKVLHEENKLADIVQLVGEDVLPDDQRLILEIAKVLRTGFLQQNAFHKEDTYVPLQKQHLMLEMINYLYEKSKEAIAMGIPISVVKDEALYNKVTRMKYTIKNDNLQDFGYLMKDIDGYYTQLMKKYQVG
jgi:V/A-type H+-transporting ATPase subunit A